MPLPDSTWRVHPFHTGFEYEACETFRGVVGGEFTAGKHDLLRHVTYSPDDSATVFRFQAPGDEPVDWWWRDDEPESLCSERFRLVARLAGG